MTTAANPFAIYQWLFTGVYGAAFLLLAVLHASAWHFLSQSRRTATPRWPIALLITSVILWTLAYLGEMTFLGIWSSVPLVIALITAGWSTRYLSTHRSIR
jgi:hypothetical protein